MLGHHHLPPWLRWPVVAGTARKHKNVTKVSHGLTATRKGEGSLGFGTNNPTLREYHEARRLTRKEEEAMAVTA